MGQLYVGQPAASGEPPQQLQGFQKVFLQPGASRTVTLSLPPRAFAYWDAAKQAWALSGGTYKLLVGSSSRDIRLQSTVSLGKTLGP